MSAPTTTNATFAELNQRLAEIHDLRKFGAFLSWDQSTMMPKGGGPVRAEQMGTITRLAHEMFVSDEIGRLLDELSGFEASLPRDSDEASLIRVARQDWDKSKRVPPELAAETARATAAGYQAWLTARPASDFQSFLPHVERIIELKRRYIDCFPDVAEPYDALLDDYERGLTAAEVHAVFNRVKEGLVPLVRLVKEQAEAVDDAPMRGHFSAEDQKRLSVRVIERWGFHDGSFRLDPTAHPFASSMATQDIRLTTRYDESYLAMSFFGTLHEMGHGLYEHGISPSLERTLLCRGVSLSLHESQSRMWENLVGRSRPFWRFAYPVVREVFPDHFARFDEEAVYRSTNKMGPSLVRVEADELTYSLHIILRFEIEQMLFNGEIKPADLAEVWNAKVKQYLGIDVPNHADGVLQDVHWSEGLFGYFPTYALGTIISSQIWERIQREMPDLDKQTAAGEFDGLRGWLVEHIHRHGRKFDPKETVAMVVGGPIDPDPYLRYLTQKVTSLYGAT